MSYNWCCSLLAAMHHWSFALISISYGIINWALSQCHFDNVLSDASSATLLVLSIIKLSLGEEFSGLFVYISNLFGVMSGKENKITRPPGKDCLVWFQQTMNRCRKFFKLFLWTNASTLSHIDAYRVMHLNPNQLPLLHDESRIRKNKLVGQVIKFTLTDCSLYPPNWLYLIK